MFNELSAAEQKEVRCYGCTVAQMREVTEQSLSRRFSNPVMMAMSLMSDAQELISDERGGSDWMNREDARQALNRAKWILDTYCLDKHRSAA